MSFTLNYSFESSLYVSCLGSSETSTYYLDFCQLLRGQKEMFFQKKETVTQTFFKKKQNLNAEIPESSKSGLSAHGESV